MFYSSIFVVSLLFLGTINQIDGLQCYKCRCIIVPGETACTDESELGCLIEYVTDSYCIIARSAGEILFNHNPNSALMFLESLHYIRATEEFRYSESTSSWQTPTITELSYGCDWNLCNTPRILNLLPNGLAFAVDSNLLRETLIATLNDPLTTCLGCSKCVNSTGGLSCLTPTCIGTCFIDDHLDDPQFNDGYCLFAFESVCVDVILDTSVHITGTYYIDDKLFDVTEIDIYCRKTNCNGPNQVQIIQKNTTYQTQINDQLYFRPDVGSTTPTPNTGLFGCYTCHCERALGSDECKVLECTIEYKNQSYCEIARDLVTYPGYEHITLGHVQSNLVPYKHYIYVEEELILYKNLTWHPSLIDRIYYVCDWELCNDGRIVEKLTTSFQFNAEPGEIAGFLQGSQPLDTCLQCTICTNATSDINNCPTVSCPSTGRCFIDQHIDDPQYDNCEYAFEADCEESVSESSIIITATYNIDDDILDFDEVDVYCSLNRCNQPSTIYSLLDLVSEDIQLDPLFYIRPVAQNTTVPPILTEPTPSSTTTPATGSSTTTPATGSSTTTPATGSSTTTPATGSSTTTPATGSSTTAPATGSSTTTYTATFLNNSFCLFILFLISNLFTVFYY